MVTIPAPYTTIILALPHAWNKWGLNELWRCYKHWIEIKMQRRSSTSSGVCRSVIVCINKGFIFTTSSTFKLTLTLLGFTMVLLDSHYTFKAAQKNLAGLVGFCIYFILGPYFYLLRMCFIITHSLQSVWRHDPHPINNTRRHFVVTGSHQARQQASHPSGPALLIILNQKGQWPNYSISQSDILKLTSPSSN